MTLTMLKGSCVTAAILLNNISLEEPGVKWDKGQVRHCLTFYNSNTGMVVYWSKMIHGENKKNFSISTAEEFIAAITSHIPDKISSLFAITAGIQRECGENDANRS
ncbi:MAG: hypothetical protein GQ469_04980 [Methanosarcinales archaeon]|nr:hypothetical protein [Methanosarcinales archaeon]